MKTRQSEHQAKTEVNKNLQSKPKRRYFERWNKENNTNFNNVLVTQENGTTFNKNCQVTIVKLEDVEQLKEKPSDLEQELNKVKTEVGKPISKRGRPKLRKNRKVRNPVTIFTSPHQLQSYNLINQDIQHLPENNEELKLVDNATDKKTVNGFTTKLEVDDGIEDIPNTLEDMADKCSHGFKLIGKSVLSVQKVKKVVETTDKLDNQIKQLSTLIEDRNNCKSAQNLLKTAKKVKFSDSEDKLDNELSKINNDPTYKYKRNPVKNIRTPKEADETTENVDNVIENVSKIKLSDEDGHMYGFKLVPNVATKGKKITIEKLASTTNLMSNRLDESKDHQLHYKSEPNLVAKGKKISKLVATEEKPDLPKILDKIKDKKLVRNGAGKQPVEIKQKLDNSRDQLPEVLDKTVHLEPDYKLVRNSVNNLKKTEKIVEIEENPDNIAINQMRQMLDETKLPKSDNKVVPNVATVATKRKMLKKVVDTKEPPKFKIDQIPKILDVKDGQKTVYKVANIASVATKEKKLKKVVDTEKTSKYKIDLVPKILDVKEGHKPVLKIVTNIASVATKEKKLKKLVHSVQNLENSTTQQPNTLDIKERSQTGHKLPNATKPKFEQAVASTSTDPEAAKRESGDKLRDLVKKVCNFRKNMAEALAAKKEARKADRKAGRKPGRPAKASKIQANPAQRTKLEISSFDLVKQPTTCNKMPETSTKYQQIEVKVVPKTSDSGKRHRQVVANPVRQTKQVFPESCNNPETPIKIEEIELEVEPTNSKPSRRSRKAGKVVAIPAQEYRQKYGSCNNSETSIKPGEIQIKVQSKASKLDRRPGKASKVVVNPAQEARPLLPYLQKYGSCNNSETSIKPEESQIKVQSKASKPGRRPRKASKVVANPVRKAKTVLPSLKLQKNSCYNPETSIKTEEIEIKLEPTTSKPPVDRKRKIIDDCDTPTEIIFVENTNTSYFQKTKIKLGTKVTFTHIKHEQPEKVPRALKLLTIKRRLPLVVQDRKRLKLEIETKYGAKHGAKWGPKWAKSGTIFGAKHGTNERTLPSNKMVLRPRTSTTVHEFVSPDNFAHVHATSPKSQTSSTTILLTNVPLKLGPKRRVSAACPLCSIKFVSGLRIYNHYSKHRNGDNQDFKCYFCGSNFLYFYQLFEHLTQVCHVGGPHTCSECCIRFHTSANMYRHFVRYH